jgi:hypothetical protein
VTSILSAGDPTLIRSRSQLVDYLSRGERPRAGWLVGSEYEKIALHALDGAPLAYEPNGSVPGIRTLLEELASCCGWQPGYDADAMVSLKTADASVTLEPGGQFELSGAPLPTIHGMVCELQRHEAELAHLANRLPLRWLWVGANPLHPLDAIDWMPKRRYGIMRDLPAHPRPLRAPHDAVDLHGPGEPRLRERSRHGREAARVHGLAANSHQTSEREQGDAGDFGVHGPESTETYHGYVAGRRREYALKAPAYPPLAAGGR